MARRYTGPSSEQILDLVRNPQRRGLRGQIEAARRRVQGSQQGDNFPLAVTKWLDALDQIAADGGDIPATYVHPRTSARLSGKTADPAATLGLADITWIQRLPTNPEAITFADAGRLATLYANYGEGKDSNNGDRVLLESIWFPVEAVHDKREAAHNLELAKVPPHTIPDPTEALVLALQQEVTELTDDEIHYRASNLVRDALDDRVTAHQDRLTEARDAAATAGSGETARLSLVANN